MGVADDEPARLNEQRYDAAAGPGRAVAVARKVFEQFSSDCVLQGLGGIGLSA